MTGMVQKFSTLQGYGWIIAGFKDRFFFHVTQWKSDVQPAIGQTVTFDVAPPRKVGQQEQAVNVTPAGAQ